MVSAEIDLVPQQTQNQLFFFNDTATTEIYTLSLHDALPIYRDRESQHRARGLSSARRPAGVERRYALPALVEKGRARPRSEEHTSELQSRLHLVCRLLLEKKKQNQRYGSSLIRSHAYALSHG